MNDDFEDTDPDLDNSNFDDFEDDDKSLGGVFRDNPAAKIAAVAGAVVLVFAVIIILGKSKDPVDQSYLGSGQEFAAPPGTEAASKEYIDAIKEVNEREVEIAEQTGGSAFPTPIEPPVDVLTLPAQPDEEEDPLQRWRRLQEERLERELQQAQTIEPAVIPDDSARRDAIAQLAALMAEQMQAVLESQEQTISYRSISTSEEFQEDEEGGDDLSDGNFDGSELEEQIIQETLLPAGEIEYAQLLIEANTDAPGPVLAQIMSGPLKGARLIGTFSEQRSFLTLNFTTLVIDLDDDGSNEETLSINAIAIDPATTLPGMATEVDRRYLSRVVLPAAAAFVSEFSATLAETGRTTVTIDGDNVVEEVSEADTDEAVAAGISSAGETLAELIEEEADEIKPLIRVAQGTPMGILFLEPVVTQDDAI